ncbi:hypothetical protein T484DRAFT_1829442 [Baffinella frigidus]|nr:hypothetical protein T484DRAFT_1829442 [Cryptophyta sp. CCMP2293]
MQEQVHGGRVDRGAVRVRDSLIDLALRFQHERVLKVLCPDEVPEGAKKRMPSHKGRR